MDRPGCWHAARPVREGFEASSSALCVGGCRNRSGEILTCRDGACGRFRCHSGRGRCCSGRGRCCRSGHGRCLGRCCRGPLGRRCRRGCDLRGRLHGRRLGGVRGRGRGGRSRGRGGRSRITSQRVHGRSLRYEGYGALRGQTGIAHHGPLRRGHPVSQRRALSCRHRCGAGVHGVRHACGQRRGCDHDGRGCEATDKPGSHHASSIPPDRMSLYWLFPRTLKRTRMIADIHEGPLTLSSLKVWQAHFFLPWEL